MRVSKSTAMRTLSKTITELIKPYGLDVERFIRECLKEKPEDRPTASGLLKLPLLQKLTKFPYGSLLLPPVAPLSMV
jgi:serine/threonine protein kinase